MNNTRPFSKTKEIFAWTLYDFANTSFSVIIVTVVYAVYFRDYIVADFKLDFWGLTHNPGDFLWSICGSVSMFVVAVTSPILGAVADFYNRKKRFVFIYSSVCIIGTIMLYFPGPGMIWQAMLLFTLANIGFEGGLVFYNGFLPQISTSQNIGKISGYGFAFGYVGALLSLLIALYYANAATVNNDITLMASSFVWAGLFFLVFSIPFYFLVKEEAKTVVNNTENFLKQGWQRTLKTIRKVKQFPQISRFLTAYFIYIDGVNTVIFFGALFATETLGFSMTEVIVFFAIIQFSAIGGSYIFGHLTDKLGPKKTINITLFIWMSVTIGAFLSYDSVSFYIVGLLAGVAMGSSQAASRALMGTFIPIGMEAEFYGFYALIGKFSAILGPLVFGVVSSTTGNQRFAVLSVLLFFVAGYLLMRRVNPDVDYKNITV